MLEGLSEQLKLKFLGPSLFLILLGVAFGAFEALEALLFVVLFVTFILLVAIGVRLWLPKRQEGTVAFFHPDADGGGGGERVLWCAVKAVQEMAPGSKVVLYTRPSLTSQGLVAQAEERFNVQGLDDVEVVHLQKSSLIDPSHYPFMTLVGQALGSVRLGAQALRQLVPEVFVDTSGWAFTYPLAWLAGAHVVAYVHYPTVSTDMLGRVWEGESTYNNDEAIANSSLKSLLKLVYYQAFAVLYGLAGAFASVVMVNSSWTGRHIRQLWWRGEPLRVFPPVETRDLQELRLDRPLKQLYLICVGQFRPEKNHKLLLHAFASMLDGARTGARRDNDSEAILSARLKLVGSCRNQGDVDRLDDLKCLCAKLRIERQVDFHVNVPYAELKALLGGAVGGVHTMVDEHFGICIVEYMAAGVIPIAHESGGPKEDIITLQASDENSQKVGYLASTIAEYSDAMSRVLKMDQRDRLKISAAARQRSRLFSQERFFCDFTVAVERFFRKQNLS